MMDDRPDGPDEYIFVAWMAFASLVGILWVIIWALWW